ncbi:DUF2194 domain-containing protein [Paenibacillus endoradicis]|uniref:DUF2194 domain-containing protein n=1 Tax=Paenibacillus endoradicis TaxID=2972487 RepID=UPI0021590123|nr:DUF2194 domain-containing protein [Paenibacillus endoradicis]MCR8657589.1 DUF2194 domain-containing protein [Paenibacillus endoradicis]
MDKAIKFRRNVYIILICILSFAIVSQVARSNLILKINNNQQIVESEQWQSFRLEAEQTMLLSDKESNQEHHCVVIDSKDSQSIDLQNNLSEVYRYMKQAYVLQDVATERLELSQCTAVSVTASLEVLGDYILAIEEYVEQGGYYFQMRIDNPDHVITQLYRKLGIVNYRFIDSNVEIHFKLPLLIGQTGKEYGSEFVYNDSLIVELDDDVTVYASGKSGIPIVWSNQYGSGKFMVYNGNNLYAKSNRGLIVGAISLMIPDYIYPIFNEKLFYIDDFPAPISSEINQDIYKEYGRNLSAFYRDIWWPDMIKASKRYNLKYTAVAIEVYEDNVIAPFEHAVRDNQTNLITFGREILKSGGEIGIHGYNHQPLQQREDVAKYYDYVSWKTTEDMGIATQEMLDYLKRAFPNYTPISYVPPSNILSNEGRKILKQTWPELRVVSAVYDTDTLNFAYVQEYKVAEDGVIEMPRMTSGYFDTEYMTWLEANSMTSLGVISHFLHPDDLLESDRSGNKKWSELYEEFEKMLNRMESTYPWTRANTSDNAALEMGYVLSSHITRANDNNKVSVKIDNQQVTQYFILRSNKRIGRLIDCDVQKIDEGTYLVTTDNEEFSIELK